MFLTVMEIINVGSTVLPITVAVENVADVMRVPNNSSIKYEKVVYIAHRYQCSVIINYSDDLEYFNYIRCFN